MSRTRRVPVPFVPATKATCTRCGWIAVRPAQGELSIDVPVDPTVRVLAHVDLLPSACERCRTRSALGRGI